MVHDKLLGSLDPLSIQQQLVEYTLGCVLSEATDRIGRNSNRKSTDCRVLLTLCLHNNMLEAAALALFLLVVCCADELAVGAWLMRVVGSKSIAVFCRSHAFDKSFIHFDKSCILESLTEILDRLGESRAPLDSVSCASLVQCCGNLKLPSNGKRIHDHIIKCGLDKDAFIGNLLIRMYGKFGALDDARALFDTVTLPDKFCSNFIIKAFARCGDCKEAFKLFMQMQLEGLIPDKFIFVSVLTACLDRAALAEGKRIHACIAGTSYQSDVVVGTALVTMYGRCGSREDSRMVFDRLPDRNPVSWKILIGFYVQNGESREALKLFEQMQLEGVLPDMHTTISVISACGRRAILAECKRMHTRIVSTGFTSDVLVGTALVHMYGQCGGLEDACRLFGEMPEQDVVLWNAMIAVYAIHGWDSSHLFKQMQQKGMMSNKVTFISMLDACAAHANLAEGIRMHAQVVGSALESDTVVGTALVNMYGKCGCLESAWRVFSDMPVHNTLSWTAMIAVCSVHGQVSDAFQFFQQMKQRGVQPDKVTLLSVLSAFSRAGWVKEACQFFFFISALYPFEPHADHFNCMIDLFGRVGRLDEAEIFLKHMHFKSTALSWMTLLSACRNQVDVERGERAAYHVFELDPGSHTPHVILASIYAAAGRLDDARKVLDITRDKGLRANLKASENFV